MTEDEALEKRDRDAFDAGMKAMSERHAADLEIQWHTLDKAVRYEYARAEAAEAKLRETERALENAVMGLLIQTLEDLPTRHEVNVAVEAHLTKARAELQKESE